MKKYLLTIFICFMPFFHSSALLAQDNSVPMETRQEEQFRTQPSEPPFFPLEDPYLEMRNEPDNFQAKFLNMLFILGLLIAFMILASWMIKKLSRVKAEQMNTTSAIKVLETRYLSPKSTIYLLDIKGQGVVVAESPTGVHHIATISIDEEI